MYQEKEITMNDKELFMEVFNRLQETYRNLSISGTLVCWKGQARFNIEGYNLCYNLLRLTQLIDDEGELR